jgi:hypothetical protein
VLTHSGSKIVAFAVVTTLASVPRSALESAPPPVLHFSSMPLAIQEQTLDVDVPPPPLPPRRELAPAPRYRSVRGNHLTDPKMPLVRTPADEDLPAWVPIAGRLTVVSACDIAENLGLAPLGTAKGGGCPDAVQLIEREKEARGAASEGR